MPLKIENTINRMIPTTTPTAPYHFHEIFHNQIVPYVSISVHICLKMVEEGSSQLNQTENGGRGGALAPSIDIRLIIG